MYQFNMNFCLLTHVIISCSIDLFQCEQLTALGEETLFLSVNVKDQHTAYFGSNIGKTFMKNNQLLHLLYQDSLGKLN